MLPNLENITFEEFTGRLKVVIPTRRNWFLIVLFTVALIVWVAMLLGVVVAMFRERYGFLLSLILLVWLFIWYRYVGRILWNRWQYYMADREVLLIEKDVLTVFRPVALWGLADAYDMKYVSPFYYNEKHHCAAFDYGSRRVYFGFHLPELEVRQLVRALNGRYFPHADFD
ncbi:MAG: hypothetical protein D6706_10010 [Chloroflexi bacterium]|nr:MAG: hypothetical protein D6706_10010 [Chloroflexota bacterium]